MSECEPVVSVDRASVAVPPLRALVPSAVVPSLNVTVPVAVEGETVAVRTTFWPMIEGFVDELKLVLVDAWVIVKFAPSNLSV